jgi:hypothetical protein
MAPHPTDQDWRCIAEQTSKEMDPAKLMTLVAKLCRALDRERGRKTEFQLQQDNQSGSFPDVA